MAARRSNRRSAGEITLVSRTAFRVIAGVTDAELTLWEHEELILPVDNSEFGGNESLYDASALKRARLIRTLAEELDVNLAGIGVILHLLDRIER